MANAARTAAACRIARLDRQKFNDLMASGEYSCAPRTTPGVPRVFEMPDLIGLFLFTRLTEQGKSVRQAADAACKVVSTLHDAVNSGKDLPEHVAVAYSMLGVSFTSAGKDANVFASHFGGAGTAHEILFAEVFNIANIAFQVNAGLADENRIVGED